MTEDRTAHAGLERLMHVLPAASRKGGARLADLADALGTSEKRIIADLEEVTDRVYYHPGGWPDDVQILIEPERVRVLSTSGFTRPTRLTARETLCLALALRGTVASAHLGDARVRESLLGRAEAHLGRAGDDDVHEEGDPFAAPDDAPDAGGHRETLLRAARDRTPCAILYLKAGAADAEARVIHPYALVHAEGSWYAVSYCCVREAVRSFRVDRVLEAAPTEGAFDVPEDFDPSEHLDGARLYRAEADVEVRVRYSGRIARWVHERAAFGMVSLVGQPDGSVVASHRVADPHWAVAHVLQYGAEAEILGPEELRGMVREVALGLSA